jgi:hypothetical protein
LDRLGQRAPDSPGGHWARPSGGIWIVEVPLDEVRPFILETEALVYEDDE